MRVLNAEEAVSLKKAQQEIAAMPEWVKTVLRSRDLDLCANRDEATDRWYFEPVKPEMFDHWKA